VNRRSRAPESDVDGVPRLVVRDEDRSALEDLVAEMLVAPLEYELVEHISGEAG
jgi:hypothetical protein